VQFLVIFVRMMSMMVIVHYNHHFYLIKEDDDGDSMESTMNHTQHNRWTFVS